MYKNTKIAEILKDNGYSIKHLGFMAYVRKSGTYLEMLSIVEDLNLPNTKVYAAIMTDVRINGSANRIGRSNFNGFRKRKYHEIW